MLINAEGILTASWLNADARPIFFLKDRPYLNAGYAVQDQALIPASQTLVGPILQKAQTEICQRAMGVRVPFLWLSCGGRLSKSICDGKYHTFVIRPTSEPIFLVSSKLVMGDVPRFPTEPRLRYGVTIRRMLIRAGEDEHEVPLDHPAMTEGFGVLERREGALHRWMEGTARLPDEFLFGHGPLLMLRIELADNSTP
jgi:hypothetical protein